MTLDTLAGQLDVSPFQLCRAFRQATGGTLHQHLTQVRLAAALDLGFSSHSYFTLAFRSHYGREPSALLRAA